MSFIEKWTKSKANVSFNTSIETFTTIIWNYIPLIIEKNIIENFKKPKVSFIEKWTKFEANVSFNTSTETFATIIWSYITSVSEKKYRKF